MTESFHATSTNEETASDFGGAKWTANAVGIGVALLFAFGAGQRLAQSDGDLFAHIRVGVVASSQGAVPRVAVLGFASSGPAVYPAWLAEAVFARLNSIGGLALIVCFAAVVAGFTHWLLADMLRRQRVSAARTIVASSVGFALASAHWLARPHLFSMLLAVALLLLLEYEPRGYPLLIGGLFALWANMHGGWAFGLIVTGCYAVGNYLEWRRVNRPAPMEKRRLIALGAAVTGTLINPYGLGLHRTVIRSLSDSGMARVISEYQPPGFHNPGDILFFVVAGLSLITLFVSRRTISFSRAITVVLTILLALRAGRNIAFFGLVGWPLVVISLWSNSATDGDRKVTPGRIASGLLSANGAPFAFVATLILALGLGHGRVGRLSLVDNQVDARRFPVEALERLRASPNGVRLLTTWTWSGYTAYAWPGAPVYFDPLVFSTDVLTTFGRMLRAQPGWREDLAKHGVNAVMLPPGVPLGDSLNNDSAWLLWYADARALIFRRVESVPASATSEPGQ